MTDQNNDESKNSKGIFNIIIGVVIGVALVTGYFKVNEFLEERKMENKILENNTQVYSDNQQDIQSTEIINGEPTDLPPYQGNNDTTNGDLLVQQSPVNNVTTEQPPINNSEANGSTWNGKALIGLEKAKQVAINTVGGGDVIYHEEDIYDIDDAPTYDFKIKKGTKVYELEIDALTGEVNDYDID